MFENWFTKRKALKNGFEIVDIKVENSLTARIYYKLTSLCQVKSETITIHSGTLEGAINERIKQLKKLSANGMVNHGYEADLNRKFNTASYRRGDKPSITNAIARPDGPRLREKPSEPNRIGFY